MVDGIKKPEEPESDTISELLLPLILKAETALAGYETSNWGDKELYDGSTLTNKDAFVYGGAATLELETYLTDRVIFLINARERALSSSSIGKFHTQFGVGFKFITN